MLFIMKERTSINLYRRTNALQTVKIVCTFQWKFSFINQRKIRKI